MPLEKTVNNWMACYAPLAAKNCEDSPVITSDGTMNTINVGHDTTGGFFGSLSGLSFLSFIGVIFFRLRNIGSTILQTRR